MRNSVVVIRILGVMLGLASLCLGIFAMMDDLPTTAVTTWIAGEASLLLGGGLLLAPWRYVVRWKFWWLPLSLLLLAGIGIWLMIAPAFVWARLHEALGFTEIILGLTAILIWLGQAVAIWYIREQQEE